MTVLRYLALNILKENTTKSSIKHKHFRVGLDEAHLLQLLTEIGCDYPDLATKSYGPRYLMPVLFHH